MYRQCLLLITLGGEQREKCKISRERRGEVQSFPAINYSVHRGRTAVAQRSHEKKQRSHYQLPHHPHFHPQAAASAAAKENHDGRGKRGVLQDSNCSGSAVRPGRSPGPQRAQSALRPSPTSPREPPWACAPFGMGECDLSSREHGWGQGGGLSQIPGGARGPPAVHPPGPAPALAFSGSDSLAPRETQEHSGSHSFHRGNNSRPGGVGGRG